MLWERYANCFLTRFPDWGARVERAGGPGPDSDRCRPIETMFYSSHQIEFHILESNDCGSLAVTGVS